MSVIHNNKFWNAATFVLAPAIRLGLKDVCDDLLTVPFRAGLYVAHQKINTYDTFKRQRDDKRFVNILNQVDCARLESDAQAAAHFVGKDWADRLRKSPRTYSGLTLKGLSARLGSEFARWYDSAYGIQSKIVHANDIDEHIQYEREEQRWVARWHYSTERIRGDLILAEAMFAACLMALHEQFQFIDGTTADLATILVLLKQSST